MIIQKEIILNKKPRGFHLITNEILASLSELPPIGLLHLFIKHSSAGITINENCDPTVRLDFEASFNKIVPENEPYYQHTHEGADDMPAHIKSTLTGHEITIPICDNQLALGTWQGIYLCEFRNNASKRKIMATIYN
ncbi:MAG: secondary thiamine-phosphate synthase enzyme YjbQ [Bacteriovoracaceae bacterium]|jgi:secondary thiamine-phosphate synthase enzyme|nr:secondary thiamine-phosphate synthase enzyme YjbQ [Bacteriovoracaceae bacterium]